MKERVLVIDDEYYICDSIKDTLQKDYSIAIASTGEDALSILEKEQFDLVILDLRLHGISGTEVLREIKQNYPETGVIVITAQGSTKIAVDCMKLGAIDYLAKPFELDELKICVKRALEDKQLRKENINLKEALNRRYVFDNIVGNSPGIREICKSIHQVAQSDSSVLISGETGTGKELVSRTIHYNSSRKSEPFKAINCGAIPKDLLESELFGYEKGAFTGAVQTKPGLIELANGGSLLLDEIAELRYDLQVKLLRVLEEHKVTHVGGIEERRVDIRLICATSKDLQILVKEGKFRKDLFYRIKVFPIYIPPLRKRKEDIPLLVNFFLKDFEEKFGSQTISPEAVSILQKYHWPGNVRELRNILERILISNQNSPHYTITSEYIPEEIYPHTKDFGVGIYTKKPEELSSIGSTKFSSLEEAVNNLEYKLITEALKKSNGNITQSAQLLSTSYRVLKYKMEKLGIKQYKEC